ncbi:unnamed protein product [Rotaria sp. Silwood2]|nr:unnamed protein product [Rotaria sp. Silwood2]CAF2564718.1 unnamed protein product [Rotaria sp. Silwood2]CAF4163735.1 unnamed protein product [Rotaria sp. Silwood2]CAF4368969.1 unnamed protein product [Rotaria sp. Silwood2]
MSYTQRDPDNPPDYYYTLNSKQQHNWMRTAKKMKKNEDLKLKYPPFNTTSNINIIHLHYLTDIQVVNELITKAKSTKTYTIDTEDNKDKNMNQGALIQIQMVHSNINSTIVLIETDYLPDRNTILFKQIGEFCSIVLNNDNKILSWGPLNKEFEHFQHLELIYLGNKNKKLNLQSLFRDWHNGNKAHPSMEKRENITGSVSLLDDTPGEFDFDDGGMDNDNGEKINYNNQYNCGHHTHFNMGATWSLQDAIVSALKKLVDKTLTVSLWQCGLDLVLNTWKNNWFSGKHYNEHHEQEHRFKMTKYAVTDCTAVTDLYFHMYPDQIINEISDMTPIIRSTTDVKIKLEDELSDISEDELIQILKPHFNKPQTNTQHLNNETTELITQTTQEEMNQFNMNEDQPVQQQQPPPLSKSEKQRIKNMKLKWKRKHHPEFQHKIKRPIYHRYDYRKIRTQLTDDNIHTSHQTTINRHKGEVIIGFKSEYEQQQAKTKMKINCFSKDQYYKRWGNLKEKK